MLGSFLHALGNQSCLCSSCSRKNSEGGETIVGVAWDSNNKPR